MTSEPPPPLSDTDKREVCALHGWVGRKAFQQDRHDLCEAPRDTFDGADVVVGDVAVDEANVADADEDGDVDEGAGDDEIDDVEEAADAESTAVVVDSQVDGDNTPEESSQRWSRASARRQGIPPKKTLAMRRITQVELAVGRAELKAIGADEPYERPKTRADCANVPRPCPFVACKYSLYLDVSDTGSIILNFPHLQPHEMPAHRSCALDLADSGAMTLEEIAIVTNLTRERIRQIELKALLRRAKPAAIAMGLGPGDAAALGAGHHVGPGADIEEMGAEGSPSDIAGLLSGGGGDDS